MSDTNSLRAGHPIGSGEPGVSSGRVTRLSVARVIAVAAGLAMTGGLLGTVAGVAVALAWLLAFSLREGNLEPLGAWLAYPVAGTFGGVCGAGLAPLFGFAVWRHVPIWRLFVHLTGGAIVGGGLAALLIPRNIVVMMLLAAIGALYSGDRLASRTPKVA